MRKEFLINLAASFISSVMSVGFAAIILKWLFVDFAILVVVYTLLFIAIDCLFERIKKFIKR